MPIFTDENERWNIKTGTLAQDSFIGARKMMIRRQSEDRVWRHWNLVQYSPAVRFLKTWDELTENRMKHRENRAWGGYHKEYLSAYDATPQFDIDGIQDTATCRVQRCGFRRKGYGRPRLSVFVLVQDLRRTGATMVITASTMNPQTKLHRPFRIVFTRQQLHKTVIKLWSCFIETKGSCHSNH